jgi:SAM-dependent methyltransferase
MPTAAATDPVPSAAPPQPAWQPRAPRLALVPQLRERVLDRTAAWLAARGVRRIALYGMGRHTRGVVRQPWLFHGIEVAAVLDDRPTAGTLAGVPVLRPEAAVQSGLGFDAIVVSSTEYEDEIAERAHAVFNGTGVEVVRLYTPDDTLWAPETTIERLIRRGLSPDDAAWLVANRGERHDALTPVIPPARTELHARRYELAAGLLAGAGGGVAADLACGTGYGTAMLCRVGGASRAVGVDLDARAVAYASRRHDAGGKATFRCADAARTGLPASTFDLAASFETVEHVEDADGLIAELHRVLKPGGTLVISTPNRIGPTPYHVHDFGFPDFNALLRSRFEVTAWIGQRTGDDVYASDLPPGMWRISAEHAARDQWVGGGGRPEFLIAVCRKGEPGEGAGRVPALETPLGPVNMFRGEGVSASPLLPASHPLWAWLGTLCAADVLWDASAGDPAPAVAAGRRGEVVVLNPDAWGHWVASETVRMNAGVRTMPLGLGIVGLTEDGPGVQPSVIAAITGGRSPTHLRVRAWSDALPGLFRDVASLRSLFVDRPPGGADGESATAAMGRAGFRVGAVGPGVAGGVVFERDV